MRQLISHGGLSRYFYLGGHRPRRYPAAQAKALELLANCRRSPAVSPAPRWFSSACGPRRRRGVEAALAQPRYLPGRQVMVRAPVDSNAFEAESFLAYNPTASSPSPYRAELSGGRRATTSWSASRRWWRPAFTRSRCRSRSSSSSTTPPARDERRGAQPTASARPQLHVPVGSRPKLAQAAIQMNEIAGKPPSPQSSARLELVRSQEGTKAGRAAAPGGADCPRCHRRYYARAVLQRPGARRVEPRWSAGDPRSRCLLRPGRRHDGHALALPEACSGIHVRFVTAASTATPGAPDENPFGSATSPVGCNSPDWPSMDDSRLNPGGSLTTRLIGPTRAGVIATRWRSEIVRNLSVRDHDVAMDTSAALVKGEASWASRCVDGRMTTCPNDESDNARLSERSYVSEARSKPSSIGRTCRCRSDPSPPPPSPPRP